MIAYDHNHALEFCQIDPKTTLVIEFLPSTQEVSALSIVFIPKPGPKLKRAQVSVDVLSITLQEDGVYSLKLRRETNSSAATKQ
jgi:hypothetical protein